MKVSYRRRSSKILMLQQGSVAWLLVILIAVGGTLGVGYIYRDLLSETKLGQMLHIHTATPAKDLYYCPMHPQIQSDKPGTCPICNMNLEKKAPRRKLLPKPKTLLLSHAPSGSVR